MKAVHKTLVSLLLAVVAVSSACGSASPTETIDATPADSQESQASNMAAPAASSESEAPKTLADYLGPMGSLARGAGAFDEDQFNEQEALIEREVQLCMQEAGFEYTPGEAGISVFIADDGSANLSEEEQAARNGFGISTSFDEIVNLDMDFDMPEPGAFDDLDPAEAEARNRALWGENALRFDAMAEEGADTNMVMIEAPEGLGAGLGGCRGEAEETVRGGVEALGAIADQLDELDNRIDSDPRVAQIRRDWASCMTKAGFTYQTRDEALQAIQKRFEPLLQAFFGAPIIVDDLEEDPLPDSGFGGTELTEEQERELADLQAHERAVATASLECEGDSAEVLEAIEAEYEAQFVEENRELLDGLGG